MPGGRQAEPDHPREQLPVEPERGPRLELRIHLPPEIDREHDRRADKSCDDSRPRGPANSHLRETPPAEDHGVVENHVDHVAGQVGVHVGLRVAFSREETADGRSQRHGHASDHEDVEVDHLLRQHFRRVTAHPQNPPAHRHQRQHHRPGHDGHPHPLRRRTAAPGLVARSEVLGHEAV